MIYQLGYQWAKNGKCNKGKHMIWNYIDNHMIRAYPDKHMMWNDLDTSNQKLPTWKRDFKLLKQWHIWKDLCTNVDWNYLDKNIIRNELQIIIIIQFHFHVEWWPFHKLDKVQNQALRMINEGEMKSKPIAEMKKIGKLQTLHYWKDIN